MTNDLPIIATTEMITVRKLDDRQVFTYQDLARALSVDVTRPKQAFSRHKSAWALDETGEYQIDTPSGTQTVRWFTARGAMRFCRYVKSGRSDALYNHLLDLWERERAPVAAVPVAPTPAIDGPPAWMAPFLAALTQNLTVLTGKSTEIEAIASGAAVKAEQAVAAASRQAEEVERIKADLADRDIDRRQLLHSELERMRDQVARALCDRVAGTTYSDNCRKFWRHIKPRAGIGSRVSVHTMTVSGYERLHTEAKRYARELAVPLLLQTTVFDAS